MNNLFTQTAKQNAPLADRMRPSALSDFIGQEHLIYKNSLLNRAISIGSIGSCIFYGPPGTGKTTIANIIASTVNADFQKLNAVTHGVGDVKEIIKNAKTNLELYGKKTFLLLDECHRWSKAQSDSVLQAIEEGSIIFIGSTTENPFTNMTRAIVSRCRVFEFKPLNKDNILEGLSRAIKDNKNGYGDLKITISNDALNHIAFYSGGDLRNAYNALELAVKTTPVNDKGEIIITLEIAQDCIQKKSLSVDETIFYDLLSAFGKSVRGSDTDAALFYSQKLLHSGVDPKIIARRLIAHASEDIGMADSNAILLANAALNAVEKLGMPECNLVLSHAIIYACEAEKSSSVYSAMIKAAKDAEEFSDVLIPNNIKNHTTGYNDKTGSYKHPHDFNGYVKQVYMPEKLKDRVYYVPSENGKERGLIRKKSKFFKLS